MRRHIFWRNRHLSILAVLLLAPFGFAQNDSAPAPGKLAACISGQIVDHDGSPLPQMHVLLVETTHTFFRVATSDADGRFVVRDLMPGKYDITNRNEDLGFPDTGNFHFTGTLERFVISADASDQCTQVTIRRPPRAGKLRIKLTDEVTGQPVANPQASFSFAGRNSWDGISFFHGILFVPPSVALDVHLGAKGHLSADVVQVPPLQPGEERVLETTLKRAGVGCMTGVVLDARGKPVPNLTVQPLLQHDELNAKLPLRTQTDNAGHFQMADLQPGDYDIFVNDQARGYDGFSTMKTYGQYPEVEVEPVSPCARITVKLMPPQARLQIEVVDAANGAPVKDFSYKVVSATPVKGWEVNSRTEEALIPPGKPGRLTVAAPGYKKSAPRALGAMRSGQIARLKILLQPDETAKTTPSPQ